MASAPAPPPDLVSRPPATGLGAVVEGFTTPLAGFRYLVAQPGLWRYAVLPVLLNLLITGALLVLLVLGAAAFAAYLHPMFPEGWLGGAMEALVAVGLLLAAVSLAVAAWVFLQEVLTGHFYARLGQAVEQQLGLPADQIRDIPWRYQIADAGRDVTLLLAVNGGLLLLHVIPLLGSLLSVVLGFTFNAYVFGSDYLDIPLSLRGRSRAEKRAFYRRHRGHVIGLGLAAFLCTLVPVVGSVLLATAAVGAVLLHRRLEPQVAPPLAG